MSTTRKLYDSNGVITKEIIVQDDQLINVTHTDIDPLLAYCKMRREQPQSRKTHYREVAEIPPFVAAQAFREGWAGDDNAWAKWYNDRQNALFHLDDTIRQISGKEGSHR